MNYAIDLNALIPVTRFNKGEAGRILDELSSSGIKVILKNNTPAAVMLSLKNHKKIPF
ncbi:hypothetical protein FACS189465_2280 [Clostridia bacterium]|nr:hypothetical protein FACS189465_2280 [Clostridia bacterium]